MSKQVKKMGRPSKFTGALGKEICERICNLETTRSIFADDAMPAPSTLFYWLKENKDFSEQYARAMAFRQDLLAEGIADIGIEARELIGLEVPGTDPALMRVAIDAADKSAKLMAPKKYGTLMKLGDADGNPLETAGKIAIEEMQSQIDRLADGAKPDSE